MKKKTSKPMLMKLLHHIHIARNVKMSWKLEEWQNIKRIHSIKRNLKSHHKEIKFWKLCDHLWEEKWTIFDFSTLCVVAAVYMRLREGVVCKSSKWPHFPPCSAHPYYVLSNTMTQWSIIEIFIQKLWNFLSTSHRIFRSIVFSLE